MIYLIDFENVHEEGFSALGRLGEKDAVYCFFTRNVAKISMSALAGMRSGQLHFIEAESGKQSLDLALVSFLGYLIGTRPQELYYDIVSNDNGFAKVAEFWNRRGNGLRVRIRKTTDMKPRLEPVKAQPQTTVNPQRRVQPQNPVMEQPAPAAEPAEPTPVPAAAAETAANTEQTPATAAAVEVKQESGRAGQSKIRGRQRSQRQRAARQEQQGNTSASVPAAATTAPAAPVPAAPAPAASLPAAPAPTAMISSEPEAAPVADAAPAQATAAAAAATVEAAPAEPKAIAKKAGKKPAEAKPAEAKAAEPAKPKAEARPLDAATLSALETAGINAAAAEFIQAQAEKYHSDKNMKQLVYRAMVKKYGQKTGTQIYNSAKKLLLK